jgi:hypothetical protein
MLLVLRLAGGAIAAAATAGALILLTMPARYVPASALPYQDKLEHLLLFGALAALWRAAGATTGMTLLFAGVLAVATELAQGLMCWGRTADPCDAAADLIGATVAMLLWQLALGRERPAARPS